MTKGFDTPEFANYLQEKLELAPFILRDLLKQFPIFEVAKILVKNYGIDKEKMGQVFGGYIGYAYVDINNVIFDAQYMKLIPKEFLKMQIALPLYKFGPAVTVATARPSNPFLQDNIEKKLNSIVSLVFAFPEDIIEYIETHYNEDL